MKFSSLVSFGLVPLAATATATARDGSANTLILDEAPLTSRPYVLRKGSGRAVSVGAQVYRFSVTGNSSAGAFTLLQTNAPSSSELGVLPHIHKAHYENFYCAKGRFLLWAQGERGEQQARLLTQGDYGAVPHNTQHTFQVQDPDTQMTGVIQPGGFEELFVTIADKKFQSSLGAPFVPAPPNGSHAGSNPGLISALESFDVYARLGFKVRRDLVDGRAGGSSSWHSGTNSLGPDAATPNFVAKGYGPKYLNNIGGTYQLVAPLAMKQQTAGNFSMGTVTLSPLVKHVKSLKPVKMNLPQPVAFQMEEGSLSVKIKGFPAVTLIGGDVVFIPAKTQFTYHATAAFTKFLYVSGGSNGFDSEVLKGATSWNYTTYPTESGYKW